MKLLPFSIKLVLLLPVTIKSFQSFRFHPNLNLSQRSLSENNASCEFSLQELRAQLRTMKKIGITRFDSLPKEKLDELTGYLQTIKKLSTSPIPLKSLGEGDKLVGKWRLMFSTEDAAITNLPKGAGVFIEIFDADGYGNLNYSLEFTERAFALKQLTAKSTFQVDPGPINPGLVSYQYEEINANIFGVTVPSGLFGLLKGRVSYIQSVYFDGQLWIDSQYQEGKDNFNVYLKE